LNEEEEIYMRYVRPQVTSSYRAISNIKDAKGQGPQELITHVFSNNSAYQADE
jgi:hypothetical protein